MCSGFSDNRSDCRYGRDRKIPVSILNYENTALKNEVMAEIAVLKKTELDRRFEEWRTESKESKVKPGNKPKKQKLQKTGEESEIQGALALMELAGN